MKKVAVPISLLTSVAVLLVTARAGTAQGQKKLVEKYTVIPIVLDDPLTSRTARIGQKFETHCTTASNGFPRNTTFVGVITDCMRAEGSQPGMLAGKFVAAILPAGQHIAIEAVPCNAQGVKITSKVGSKEKKKRTGRGAVGGAALGGIIGGDLTGALVGGAVGAGVGHATKGKTTDAEIKAGAHGYLLITKSVWLPAGA
jgi:hypothetical protein